jgi:glycosyltransferase involved in cell wall biosynthesis
VKEVPLRRLLAGTRAAPERILLASVWFRGHVNPRYAELLHRLGRLDACLPRFSDRRIPRGLQYRAFRATRPLVYRSVLGRARSGYRNLLSLDFEQLGVWRGDAVMDADDPFFTDREVGLLNGPAVKAYVVTAERAARRYESMGVEKPWVVIPQGVSLRSATPELRAETAAAKTDGELVVGWMAAFLLTEGDRDSDNPLYNVDHLLDLWERIHARVPHARLWLIGTPTERLRRRLDGRDDVVLFGRLPRERALATASHFDVAVYPRTQDTGIQAAKVAEFMGLGVPTVSYDYEVTRNLRETGAGILVPGPREFVDAVGGLLEDDAARAGLAAAALRAGEQLDWDVLARRYETDVLDVYLPAGR